MKHSFTAAILANAVHGLDNGLGLTPQMGWNTWNTFACDIDEKLIKETADLIVDLGLQKLGYEYLNLDDCWQAENRTADGHVMVDKNFPSGMKSLADYIHSKGMKFGLYSSAGTKTCQGRAGGMDNEEIDAQDYADWGVDYLKYDNCFNEGRPALERYPAMRDALNKTGRPIFYSICNWGEEHTTQWGPSTGNSWRTTIDINDHWASVELNFFLNQIHGKVSGPGGWNDPDMLEVGVKTATSDGLTHEEEKTHFALWAVAKAPLIIGADLRTISKDSLKILMNEELIAVNQDPKTEQAKCFGVVGCYSWVHSLVTTMANGAKVVVVTNWSFVPTPFYFSLSDIGLTLEEGQTAIISNLYDPEDISGTDSVHKPIWISPLYRHQSKVLKIQVDHIEKSENKETKLNEEFFKDQVTQ